ncbi:MAG: nucleotidyltransferase family protein [Armatimonadetes bacterium]|nr:nucleotidyltransferase family protein [Armatimonadota bacterium]
MNWGVVVAAGGLVRDPLASAIGTPRKALAVISGRSCLSRTLDAVKAAGLDTCVTVSGDDVADHVHHGELVHEAETQIENARIAVEALPPVDGVLFLPADTPMLSGAILTKFVAAVEQRIDEGQERWFAAGLTGLSEFRKEFPGIQIQAIKLSDGDFLSGALFAASPDGFFHAIGVIDQMSHSRRNQLGMLWKLGLWTVVCYLMHRMSLNDAEQRLGRVMEGQAIIVTGCHPSMAADIDDVADYDELRIHANLSGDGSAQ